MGSHGNAMLGYVHSHTARQAWLVSLCTSDALAVASERSGVKGKPLVPCAGEYCVLQSRRDLLAMDSQIKQNRRETLRCQTLR